MIHLDANVLINLSKAGSTVAAKVGMWIRAGERLGTAAPSWQEYVTGPVTPVEIAKAVLVLQGGILPYDKAQAEKAAEFFNLTGRRRTVKFDCMIAAAAVVANATLATSNGADFLMFVPFGLKLEVV
ncbi:MAG: Ribonuclease VapC [Verrucomicrobiales bacterium]|nr:Ribonuclease VapC [Verrucomicrobiales bacterium]